MRKVEEYRRHANECRKMATSALNEEASLQFLEMAETWDSLAEDREEHVARQKRIAALESRNED